VQGGQRMPIVFGKVKVRAGVAIEKSLANEAVPRS
jgi:hypothetical protein